MDNFWSTIGIAVAAFVVGCLFAVDGMQKVHRNDCMEMAQFRIGDEVFRCSKESRKP